MKTRAFLLCAAMAFMGCGGGVPRTVQDEIAKTPSGSATIVFFTDFQCPFCRKTHQALAEIQETRPNRTRVVLKHVPLPRHPDAKTAARGAVCVERLTPALLNDYAHALFSSNDLSEGEVERLAVERGVDKDKYRACLADPATDQRIQQDIATFDAIQGDGVPIVFVGKKRLEGMLPRGPFAVAIDDAIKESGGSPVAPTVVTAETLPFIHDDYPKALAQAKKENKPLFVDAWATWCHSCQSLRTHVLTDPTLGPLAKDFVWLSVDTEKDVNAEWVRLHPHSALPTLWVIDPTNDRAILKWAGTATAAELRDLLDVSRMNSAGSDVTAAFVRGNHAMAAGDLPTAEKELRAALASATPTHPHRAKIVEALTTLLSLNKQWPACTDLVVTEARNLPAGTSRASALVAGLECAEKAESPSREALFTLALADARGRDTKLLADDRSSLYEALVGQKKDLAGEWSAFLDGEAAKATSNDARAALDPHRLLAYMAMGAPDRAIPMLQRSAKDFPQDYNPPARLARAYLEMKRLDDAQKEAERALALVYGPRVMRVLALKADIAKARGDKATEIAALEEALQRSDKATLTEGQKAVREGFVKRLAKLREP